jgi:Domain of unknown function (DUF4282)
LNSLSQEKPPHGTAKVRSWDLLTFDRLLTAPVIHIIYWCGLGLIILAGFAVVGAAVGLTLRGEGAAEKLIAVPALVAGALVVAILALLWRALCEFYVAIFRISDDLRALREAGEAGKGPFA